MTPEEVNREIAEKVMDAYKGMPFQWSTIFSIYPQWVIHDGSKNAYVENYTVFDPMLRIEHAWMVVEKFRQAGYWCHLFGRPEKWSCGMAHLKDTTKNDVLVDATTAQEAICLAALKAKEGRNE